MKTARLPEINACSPDFLHAPAITNNLPKRSIDRLKSLSLAHFGKAMENQGMKPPGMTPLVERAKVAPHTSFQAVAGRGDGGFHGLLDLPPALREEVIWLFREIDQIRLFSEDFEQVTRRNGWHLDSRLLSIDVLSTIGDRTGGPLDYLENYRLLGSWSSGDSLAIGATGQHVGKIAIVFSQIRSEGGNLPLIARTLGEWIGRTLDDGPDCRHPYWRRQGFEELGSAIPGDPAYESPAIA